QLPRRRPLARLLVSRHGGRAGQEHEGRARRAASPPPRRSGLAARQPRTGRGDRPAAAERSRRSAGGARPPPGRPRDRRPVGALACAHAVGVVHRDLKPGNVMLTGGGNPVLVDFGLASLRDASKGPLSTVLFGTPAYLAPEQARAGKMGSDVRSDVYQLGIMLYELVTLERPWSE